MDLVKGACRTHGGECNAAHNARTLPMAGAQFKQNHVKLSSRRCAVTQPIQWSIVSGAYVQSDTRSPMTRFSQPSFLNGPPQPLVLTMDGQGRTPFELYRLIASPSQPSFLLDSGKRTDGGSHYSFLGSDPFSVLTGRQGQAALRTHEGHEYSSQDPFGSLCRLFAQPPDRASSRPAPFLGRSRRLLQLRSRA